MGKLTPDVFNESCCDGGECSVSRESAQPCGCDKGANHLCDQHGIERMAFMAGYGASWGGGPQESGEWDFHIAFAARSEAEEAYASWKRSTW